MDLLGPQGHMDHFPWNLPRDWGDNVCQDKGGLEAALSLLCGVITSSLESASLGGLTQGNCQLGGSEPLFFEPPSI